jgi:hypothetical protein
MACGNQTGNLFVWNITQCKMSALFKSLEGCIRSLEFMGSNDRLVLVSGGGSSICDHNEEEEEV